MRSGPISRPSPTACSKRREPNTSTGSAPASRKSCSGTASRFPKPDPSSDTKRTSNRPKRGRHLAAPVPEVMHTCLGHFDTLDEPSLKTGVTDASEAPCPPPRQDRFVGRGGLLLPPP